MPQQPRSVDAEARRAVRELKTHARPASTFDASRYFRADEPLEFLNVGTPVVRALGTSIARAHRDDWSVADALAFADILIRDRRFEAKGVGIEALACFRRQFVPSHLTMWKRWLAQNRAANWATTDSICGSLVSPLLIAHPELVAVVKRWTAHRNMWVRRASAVALVRLAARGQALDDVYEVAAALLGDPEDLMHKANGWLLREAGRTDRNRLERFLRRHGPRIPRTTLRYAIEHFAPEARTHLLVTTKSPGVKRQPGIVEIVKSRPGPTQPSKSSIR